MQILIISLPSGEQVTTLSHTIDSDEAMMGQSTSCQILLPDQQQNIADRHARLFREDDQWYLENLSSKKLRVNMTDLPRGQSQRHLLSDGDIIGCGEYRLMVSDFSPWQESTVSASKVVAMHAPELSKAPDLAPEYCLIPAPEESPSMDHLDDPFLSPEQPKDTTAPPVTLSDFSMKTGQTQFSEFSPQASHSKPLIDVLAKLDEEEDDWSINRNLWSGYQEQTPGDSDSLGGSIPLLSELAPSPPPGQDLKPPDPPGHKTVFQAMLEALELMLTDLSPENLEQQFNQTSATPESDTLLSGTSDAPDYWKQYHKFYQRLMSEQHYRLLFLHRLRDAMRQHP